MYYRKFKHIFVHRTSDRLVVFMSKIKKTVIVSFLVVMIISSLSSVCVSAFTEAYINDSDYFSQNNWNWYGTSDNIYTTTKQGYHNVYCMKDGSSEDNYYVKADGTYFSRYDHSIRVVGNVRSVWYSSSNDITNDSGTIQGLGNSTAQAVYTNGFYGLNGHYAKTYCNLV